MKVEEIRKLLFQLSNRGVRLDCDRGTRFLAELNAARRSSAKRDWQSFVKEQPRPAVQRPHPAI
jgi:hypothetical protein